jgi:hypothetical protein
VLGISGFHAGQTIPTPVTTGGVTGFSFSGAGGPAGPALFGQSAGPGLLGLGGLDPSGGLTLDGLGTQLSGFSSGVTGVGLEPQAPGVLGLVGVDPNAPPGGVTFTAQPGGVTGLSINPAYPGLFAQSAGTGLVSLGGLDPTELSLFDLLKPQLSRFSSGVTGVGLEPQAPGVLGLVGVDPNAPPGGVTFTAQPGGVTGLSINPAYPGVFGQAALSPGVFGLVGVDPTAPPTVPPGYNLSALSAGVSGLAVDSDLPGVLGQSDQAAGVLGLVGPLSEVAVTPTAIPAGVSGISLVPQGVGVNAIASGQGIALNVEGTACFSTSGTGQIPAHKLSVFVPDPGVTSDSKIFVTATSNPYPAQQLSWVSLSPGSGFTVHLPRESLRAVSFCYLRIC